MNYVTWALVGMAGYSCTTLFMRLAIRDGKFSSFLVLAIATIIVTTSTVTIALCRGDLKNLVPRDFASGSALWSYATGIALAIAVCSLFRALALGPASVVVPLYGMFIVGGAVLAVLFLGEPVTARKVAGIALAVFSIYLIASKPSPG